MNKDVIKIGTRKSPLAMWQAETVQNALIKQGFKTEIVPIKTEGDIDLVTPLYEMGIQGVFTKAADTALLNHEIDIAVHSLKDVPTQMARGLTQAAVLKRHSPFDILVFKSIPFYLADTQSKALIATGSIRRKAQWLHRFPNHLIENLRGNVNTRLQKLDNNAWDGAIFAAAGLERIDIRPENSIDLDWLLPAPAQGAVTVVCREKDDFFINACQILHDEMTALCTHIERDFLRHLMGGCSTPIAALAIVENDLIVFKGNICGLNGEEKLEIELNQPINAAFNLGTIAAQAILNKGADKLIQKLKIDIKNEDLILNF